MAANRWTPDIDQVVREHWDRRGSRWLSDLLGIDETLVRRRASTLGLGDSTFNRIDGNKRRSATLKAAAARRRGQSAPVLVESRFDDGISPDIRRLSMSAPWRS